MAGQGVAMIDVSESQLPEGELAEFLDRVEREEAAEAVRMRELRRRMYSFRFVGGML
jgi:hypothetical protein